MGVGGKLVNLFNVGVLSWAYVYPHKACGSMLILEERTRTSAEYTQNCC